MDKQRTTNKDLEFLNKYLSNFKDILRFDENNGYMLDVNKNLWVIKKPKDIYIFIRNITEKFFTNYRFTDTEIIDWTNLVKKNLPKIKVNNHLILTNNKLYNIKTKAYINFTKVTKDTCIYMYTPLNIKQIKKYDQQNYT